MDEDEGRRGMGFRFGFGSARLSSWPIWQMARHWPAATRQMQMQSKRHMQKASKRQVQKAKCTGMGTAVTKPDGGIVMAVKSRLFVGSGKYRSGPRQRYGIGSRSLSVQGAREWHVHRLAESWWGGTRSEEHTSELQSRP